jgi:hypothetical protein
MDTSAGQFVKASNSVLVCETSMRSKSNWARIVVAVFTAVAMFYSFACTTSCAVGVCPNQTQQMPSHDCEPSGAHHSHHSSAPAPDKPDCSSHSHPTVLFPKSGDVAKIQLTAAGHAVSPGVSATSASLAVEQPAGLFGSDLAPPLTPRTPLYQQISVLRI